MHPTDPNTIVAASYERWRDEYDGGNIPKSGGPGSGLWKTTDAGENWTRLTAGLPTADMGRIGVNYSLADPNVLYAVIEVTGQGGRDQQGVYRSNDGGETWEWKNSVVGGPAYYYGKIYPDPNDVDRVYVQSVQMSVSTDGGATFGRFNTSGVHVDHHSMWIDPDDSDHILLGNDGGPYVTYDGGRMWDHLNHVAIGTFYDVNVSNEPLYWVFGGLQDNGSWGAPTRVRNGVIVNEDWVSVGGGDGFVCLVDPSDPNIIYAESQNGGMRRVNKLTGESASLRPQAAQGERFRFNWKTPMILSHHNPKIFYCAGNYVFKSLNMGDNLQRISPELTRIDRGAATALAESPLNPDVLYVGCEDGKLWVTRDGGANWTDITEATGITPSPWVSALETSRFAEGRVYATLDAHRNDDNNPYVLVSEDYGQTWTNLSAGLPWGTSRTTREDVENENVLYVGTEFGAFVSIDRGAHWTKINNNLPTTSVREIRVHPTEGDIIAATHGRSIWILDIEPIRQMSAEIVAKKAHLYEPKHVYLWVSQPRRGGDGARTFRGENPPDGAQVYYSISQPVENVELQFLSQTGEVLSNLQARSTPGLHRVNVNLRARSEDLNINDTIEADGDEERDREAAQQSDVSDASTAAAQTQTGAAQQTGADPQQGGRRGGRGGQARGGRGGDQARGGRGGAQARGGRGGGQARGGGRGGRGGGGGTLTVSPGTYYVQLTVDGETQRQPIRIMADPILGGN
jgi:photosystem II stability/assembly factor-like uncharacterized protein